MSPKVSHCDFFLLAQCETQIMQRNYKSLIESEWGPVNYDDSKVTASQGASVDLGLSQNRVGVF
jgi:hypothetical protein